MCIQLDLFISRLLVKMPKSVWSNWSRWLGPMRLLEVWKVRLATADSTLKAKEVGKVDHFHSISFMLNPFYRLIFRFRVSFFLIGGLSFFLKKGDCKAGNDMFCCTHPVWVEPAASKNHISLPFMKSHPFEQNHFNDASTKHNDAKLALKNVEALEDGRDFDPNELEELICLVEAVGEIWWAVIEKKHEKNTNMNPKGLVFYVGELTFPSLKSPTHCFVFLGWWRRDLGLKRAWKLVAFKHIEASTKTTHCYLTSNGRL